MNKNTHSKQQRENRGDMNSDSDTCGTKTKIANICVISVLEGEEKKGNAEKVFKEIIF